MKKMMIAALMLLGSSAAFAGDSEPLKAILNAKTYDEAAQLVQSNLSQLAGNSEKAKAYDKLYQLAMSKVNAEQTTQLENQTNKQMGKEGNKPVDEAGLYKAVNEAFDAVGEVYKYDNMPNEKGKVKPRFANDVEASYNLRGQLINGGIYYQGKKDDANAYKFLSRYVDTADEPMYAGHSKDQDQNLNEIAYFATYYAFQNKEYKKAEKYVQYALKSSERAKDAKQLQLAILGSQLQTRQDSIAYAQKLEEIYTQDPSNDAVLTTMAGIYNQLGMKDKTNAVVDAALAKNPNGYGPNYAKGFLNLQDKNYDAAADAFEKALPSTKDDQQKVFVNSFIGQAYFYKAQDRVAQVKGVLSQAAKAQFNDVYNKAISYLEVAKNLDVTKENKNLWAYPLYGCYYFVKGAQAPETKAAAADAGVAE